MFTRKPKSIVRHVIDLTTNLDAKQASHTWMDKDDTRSARFGSTSRETFAMRQQADRNRKLVARYSDSKIVHSIRSQRGNVRRIERKVTDTPSTTPSSTQPLSVPNDTQASRFYPDFRPKL